MPSRALPATPAIRPVQEQVLREGKGETVSFMLGTADNPVELKLSQSDPLGLAFQAVKTALETTPPAALFAGLGVGPTNPQGLIGEVKVRWAEAQAASFGDDNLAQAIFSNQLINDATEAQNPQGGGELEAVEFADLNTQLQALIGDYQNQLAQLQTASNEGEEFFLNPGVTGNQPTIF